ncbi:MAG TPA: type II toxin-antitoxin system RelE/ParE family toxin [Verrucomicrobiae bacterium]|jgi:plasmid stabilization system protein ParE|nr:type II toxin-antitoxin system RelE/ParE family toxin [Verrucomicrobiae bacterium]
MSRFLLAPSAKSDLVEIWNYYASEVGDADLADRMRDEIFVGIRVVARTPDLGHFRRDLANEPLRFWRVRSYLIVYRGEARPVQIVRILHGARDVQAVLSET